MVAAATLLVRLRAELARDGLHIVLPLSQPQIDRAGIPVRVESLLPAARSLVLVADGGRAFFEGFTAKGAGAGEHPLDRYTERVIPAAAKRALAGAHVEHRVFYPFVSRPSSLPFVRLGEVAGLGAPGPLGLQIHPVYGPWWAYRAVIVWTAPGREVDEEPLAGAGCDGCEAPCVTACPPRAVDRKGFRLAVCVEQRRAAPDCRLSCAARAACVRGPSHQYGTGQIAFHMQASLATIMAGSAHSGRNS